MALLLESILHRTRVAARLRVALALVVAPLAVVGLLLVLALRENRRDMQTLVEDRLVPLRQLKAVSDGYGVQVLIAAGALRLGTERPADASASLRRARTTAKTQWVDYERTSMVPAESALIPKVDVAIARMDALAERLGALIEQGDKDAVGRFVDTTYLPAASALFELIGQLSSVQEEVGWSIEGSAAKRVSRAQIYAPALLLLGLFVALALGQLIASSLAKDVAKIIARMREVAGGDMSQTVAVEGRDEFAEMAAEFNRMVLRLRETLDALHGSEAAQRGTLSELAANNRKLEDANLRLKEVDTLKANVTAMLVHDVRSPLMQMGILVQLLRANLPVGGEEIEQADGALGRVTRLLEEMLELYRSEAGEVAMNAVPLEPAPWLKEAVAPHSLRAKAQGVDFRLDLVSPLPVIRGDAIQLSRVVANLLDNALKFTPEGGTIRVEAASASGEGLDEGTRFLRISVEDTGRGIAPEQLPYIFDPFRQTRASDASTGVGLGLAIVQRLVAGHRGEVSVRSRIGVGTHFNVLIPSLAPADCGA